MRWPKQPEEIGAEVEEFNHRSEWGAVILTKDGYVAEYDVRDREDKRHRTKPARSIQAALDLAEAMIDRSYERRIKRKEKARR